MESYPNTSLIYSKASSASTATSKTPCISSAITINVSTALLRQESAHLHIRYPTLALSLASAVLLVTAFSLIRLTVFVFIIFNWGFVWLYSIVVLVLLDSLVFFNSIQLTFNVFIFDPSHTIWITLQSGFREPHIWQGVFEIFQYWNREIFHNYDNWIWVWREHSSRENKNIR